MRGSRLWAPPACSISAADCAENSAAAASACEKKERTAEEQRACESSRGSCGCISIVDQAEHALLQPLPAERKNDYK